MINYIMPKRMFSMLMLCAILLGCGTEGPSSTMTKSDSFTSLTEKINFLNQYVIFRRVYEELDFDINYQNNSGGMVPGPSDWDIRIIAIVPQEQLSLWTKELAPYAEMKNIKWLSSVPTTIDYSNIKQWYQGNRKTVGIDPVKRIIVYRLSSN